MSFGIPSLYIASNDSELSDYAKKYKHAECFSEKELDQAIGFIEKLSVDKQLANNYGERALETATIFKRDNADKIIDLYL